MIIRKACKFRLKPTRQQELLFRQYAGMNRYVWNAALGLQKARLDIGKKILKYVQLAECLPYWKKREESAWLKEAPSQTLQQTLKFLDRALWDAFNKNNPKRFPKFKKKGLHDSFRFPQGFKIEENNSRIFLPKIGWLRYYNSQNILGTAKNITISRRGRHWYASIQVEQVIAEPKHQSTTVVGIDLGVKNFAALSNGKIYAPLNSLRRKEIRLKTLQRRLSKKQKGSKNFYKAKKVLSNLHLRIADARGDFLNKTSHEISKNHAVVVLEDLQVQQMSRSARGTVENPGQNVKAKSGLNRAILDQGWGEFRRQLEYKQHWQGGEVVLINPCNTSRACPECKHIAAENRRSQADFCCTACGYSKNADLNAAINILAAARGATPAGRQAAGHAVSACGETALADSVKQEPARKAA